MLFALQVGVLLHFMAASTRGALPNTILGNNLQQHVMLQQSAPGIMAMCVW